MADAVKAKFSFSGLKIEGTFTKRLDRDLQRLMRQGVRAWIIELFTHVAQWSGETAGSIKFAEGTDGNLARFLNVALPINAPHPRDNKNQFTGGPQGHYSFVNDPRGVYRFNYRSDVPQYFLNEFFKNVSPTSPWNSSLFAEQAFEAYLRDNIEAERFSSKIKTMIVKLKDSNDDARIVTF